MLGQQSSRSLRGITHHEIPIKPPRRYYYRESRALSKTRDVDGISEMGLVWVIDNTSANLKSGMSLQHQTHEYAFERHQ